MQKDQDITAENAEEVGRTFKIDRDPYGDGILYTKKTIKTRSVAEYPIHRNYVPHG